MPEQSKPPVESTVESPVESIPYAKMLGIRTTELSKERIVAELHIRPDLCTSGGIMHGGAIMSFADTLGAIGARLNLPPGSSRTTTTESKTNFLSGAPAGTTVIGVATPVKVGRRLSVWQTRICTQDDKLIALITQTQMVL
ncbi:MAG: PaaI family thioesterase [Burkholderiaceae bacterium]